MGHGTWDQGGDADGEGEENHLSCRHLVTWKWADFWAVFFFLDGGGAKGNPSLWVRTEQNMHHVYSARTFYSTCAAPAESIRFDSTDEPKH